jgi:hypothetical protein
VEESKKSDRVTIFVCTRSGIPPELKKKTSDVGSVFYCPSCHAPVVDSPAARAAHLERRPECRRRT